MRLTVRAHVLAVLAIALLGFNSCGDDDCQIVDTYYYIDERAKEIFPYTGEDTLHFLHILDGDSTELELFGKGRKHGFNKKAYISNCDTPKEDLHEYYKYTYKTADKETVLTIDFTKRNPFPAISRSIIFSIDDLKTPIYYTTIEDDSLIRDAYTTIKSVKFNKKTYKDLIRVSTEPDDVTDFTKDIVLFHNKDLGFIRIKNRTTGEIYQLL